jgi:hypothetical protein
LRDITISPKQRGILDRLVRERVRGEKQTVVNLEGSISIL